jgi:hypothetical protein
MSILTRSQIIQPGDTVMLRARFTGPEGTEIDLDTLPTVTIVQPSGGVAVGPTNVGVTRIGVGQYQFNYCVGLFPQLAVWQDIWRGILGGYEVLQGFSFVVHTTQMPAINSDGQHHLGDDVGFNFSQNAICNINQLLKSLKARLKSSGKSKTTDEYGNIIYKDCDIYTVDELVTFLCSALSMFNEIPHFTMFSWEDTPIIEQFHDVLTQGALYLALGAQSLIERGREFQINDNGIGFTPPTISELANSKYQTEMTNWYDKCKLIKNNMRSAPLGLLALSFPNTSPQVRRLRTLRQRQIF